MNERKFFNGLNYTLGNEDTSFELTVLPDNTDHVFAVAGSGARILPLLSKQPRLLTCVDTSQAQLWLTELRISAARILERDQYLAFWGFPPISYDAKERQRIFAHLSLSEDCRSFFQRLFAQRGWESILYEGRWERTFTKLSRVGRIITGSLSQDLFHFGALGDQLKYLQKAFPRKRWTTAIVLLGNAVVFNALLYRGSFPRKNLTYPLYRFYLDAFNRLFMQGLARENFFLQMILLGELRFAEGLPLECDPKIFNLAKQGLENCEVQYRCGDIIDMAKQVTQPITFLSFSDAPSYFSGQREFLFLQDIADFIASNGIVATRHYLHFPEKLDTKGYISITENHRDAIEHEKVQMYRLEVYRRTA